MCVRSSLLFLLLALVSGTLRGQDSDHTFRYAGVAAAAPAAHAATPIAHAATPIAHAASFARNTPSVRATHAAAPAARDAHGAAQVARDSARSEQAARDAFYAGRFQEARDLLRPFLPGPAATIYFDTYRLEGAYDAGLRDVSARLAAAPSDPYLLGAQGMLLAARGRTDEALNAYVAALSHPENRWAHAVALATLLESIGRRTDAEQLYTTVQQEARRQPPRSAPELLSEARASARLGDYHNANESFRLAHQVDPENRDVLYYWADLFREKYNEADARRTFEEALALGAADPDVLVGIARTSAGFSEQEHFADAALSVNPNHVGALALKGSLRIIDGSYASAESLLVRAMEVNPASLEARAHRAAIQYLRGDSASFRRSEAAIRSVHRQPSAFYTFVAEDLGRRFRYPDAAVMACRAADIDPGSSQALVACGTAMLRTSASDEARPYLSAGFDSDPFNLFAGNTLTLLDSFAGFDVLESEHFVLRVHASESAVLGSEMLRLAEVAFDSLSRRYPYRPEGKIHIEAYHDADDFAVRIAGVPHIGLLGVCFGDVLALNTPRAQQDTPYNWARTLWHELAHTMAIGAARYQVPRWFTEGLSVYEEQRVHPEWGRDMDIEFFTALDQGKLLPLNVIDRGFTRPTFPSQVMLSYDHAARVIDFIVREYGFDAVVGTLSSLASGQGIEAALQRATGFGLAALDAAFREDMMASRGRFASVLPDLYILDPESTGGPQVDPTTPFFRDLKEANEKLNAGDTATAEAAFRRALDLYPGHIGPGNAYQGLATIYAGAGKEEDRAAILQRYLVLAEHGATEARDVAAYLATVGDTLAAIGYLERSLHVEPYHVDARAQLAAWYTALGRHAEAVHQREAILALNPADQARARYDLAISLHRSGRRHDARHAVVRALELAPGFRDAQRLLLQVVDPAP